MVGLLLLPWIFVVWCALLGGLIGNGGLGCGFAVCVFFAWCVCSVCVCVFFLVGLLVAAMG